MDCSIVDCHDSVRSRGWCYAHYTRWKRHGDPNGGGPRLLSRNVSTAWRFWSKVEFTDTCWLWTACKWSNGYASFSQDGRRTLGHRYAYEFCVGPIPAGLKLDHTCRVKHCVSPDHLEPVTSRENTLRGIGPSAVNARKTHCNQGHEFTDENTYVFPDGRQRQCRTCIRRWQRNPVAAA